MPFTFTSADGGPTFALALSDLESDPAVVAAIERNRSLMYLIDYGYRNSMRDAKALPKPGKESDALNAAILAAGGRDAYVEVLLQQRHQSLLDQDPAGGTRGPQLRGVDAYVRDAAEAALRAEYRRQGKPWPSGRGSADLIRQKITDLRASPAWPAIVAEGQRQYESDQRMATLDLSGLI